MADTAKTYLSLRRSRTPSDPHRADRAAAEKLLQDVWGFGPVDDLEKCKAIPCFSYFQRLLNDGSLHDEAADLRHSPQQSKDVGDLLQIIKTNSSKTVSEIRTLILEQNHVWISDSTKTSALDKIISLAVRLWLFVEPDINDGSRTLQEAIRASFAQACSGSPTWLLLDFTAYTLQKRAGFRFKYTSDITEHLTFASRYEIRIFCHASVMERYRHRCGVESQLYPAGLLDEFSKSMNLLRPMEDGKEIKRVRKIEQEEMADLEVGMGFTDKRDVRTYKVFGARLANIQERLETEEQARRNATAIMIAIWGIGLTAFFGLVSAATGLVSMWAALKQIAAV